MWPHNSISAALFNEFTWSILGKLFFKFLLKLSVLSWVVTDLFIDPENHIDKVISFQGLVWDGMIYETEDL